jgi:hypothetical protein
MDVIYYIITTNTHLKGNLFELGLVNSTECDACKQASETALHIFRD